MYIPPLHPVDDRASSPHFSQKIVRLDRGRGGTSRAPDGGTRPLRRLNVNEHVCPPNDERLVYKCFNMSGDEAGERYENK